MCVNLQCCMARVWCLLCVCFRSAHNGKREKCIKCDRLSMSHASDLKIYRPKYPCGKSVTHTSVHLNGVIYISKRSFFSLSLRIFRLKTLFVHCVYCITMPYTLWMGADSALPSNTAHTRSQSSCTVTSATVAYHLPPCDSNVDFRLILWIRKTIIDYIDVVSLEKANLCSLRQKPSKSFLSRGKDERKTRKKKKNETKLVWAHAHPTNRLKTESETGVYRFSWFMEWIGK